MQHSNYCASSVCLGVGPRVRPQTYVYPLNPGSISVQYVYNQYRRRHVPPSVPRCGWEPFNPHPPSIPTVRCRPSLHPPSPTQKPSLWEKPQQGSPGLRNRAGSVCHAGTPRNQSVRVARHKRLSLGQGLHGQHHSRGAHA
ncbi:hypothetical protein LZ30DRAFT_709749, partial [Colletotrichum cereale]